MWWIVLGLVVMVAAVQAYVRLAPSDPADWHVMPQSAEAVDMPNGVQRVVYPGNDPLGRIDRIIRKTPRTEVLAGSPRAGPARCRRLAQPRRSAMRRRVREPRRRGPRPRGRRRRVARLRLARQISALWWAGAGLPSRCAAAARGRGARSRGCSRSCSQHLHCISQRSCTGCSQLGDAARGQQRHPPCPASSLSRDAKRYCSCLSRWLGSEASATPRPTPFPSASRV